MKVPRFEVSAGATRGLLATRTFVMADLYTFSGGLLSSPLRYTTADIDISDGTNTWSHSGPLLDQRSGKAVAHWKVGLDVDTWQIIVMPRAFDPVSLATYPDTIGGQPWLAAVRGGALRGAIMTVERAIAPGWPNFGVSSANLPFTPTGIINIFTGDVAAIDFGRSAAFITANSLVGRLTVSMPRNLWQAGCRFTLFDQGCALSAGSFSQAKVVSSVSGVTMVTTSSPPAPNAGGTPGTYALGRVLVTSGANAGFQRAIRNWDGASTFTLLAPFFFPFAGGETVTLFPGCDKSFATCTGVYGNAANFGGEDLIPAPETAI